MFKNLLVYC